MCLHIILKLYFSQKIFVIVIKGFFNLNVRIYILNLEINSNKYMNVLNSYRFADIHL